MKIINPYTEILTPLDGQAVLAKGARCNVFHVCLPRPASANSGGGLIIK